MDMEKQLEIIILKSEAEFQRELHIFEPIQSYEKLTEALSKAENRVADMRRSRVNRRSTIRRLQSTKDSVAETETESETDSKQKK